MEAKYTLLQSKNNIGILHGDENITIIDRESLKPVGIFPDSEVPETKIQFCHILGIFSNKNHHYLGLITQVDEIIQIRKDIIYKVVSCEVVPIHQEEDSESLYFKKLIINGLEHCNMYFCETWDLTQTYIQHRYPPRQSSREEFIWNINALKQLQSLWQSADICQKVIAGDITLSHHLRQYYPPEKPTDDLLMIISRRSNKNGGCHNWNRGCDTEGNAANFIETEELYFVDKNNFISHIEISGSPPLFWSQYPTMKPSRPFHFGSEHENHRRFQEHFDKLKSTYRTLNGHSSPKITLVSLLSDHGKESVMNKKIENQAKQCQIEFKHLDINELLKTPNAISNSIEAIFFEKIDNTFTNTIDESNCLADATIVENDKVIVYQQNLLRVNCASSLDRTSVFMSIVNEKIMKRKLNQYFPENQTDPFDSYIHRKLWNERANIIAQQYAGTPGMKIDMIGSGNRTLGGKIHDIFLQVYRFGSSVAFEGRLDDSINAVLQERKFTSFNHRSLITLIFLFLFLIIQYFYIWLLEGQRQASHIWNDSIKEIIDHPHIDDLRDADEFQD